MRAQGVSSWDLPIRPRAAQPGIGNPVTKAEYHVQAEQLRYSPILHVCVSMYMYMYMYIYVCTYGRSAPILRHLEALVDDGVGPRGIVLRACTSASWLRDEGKTPNQALNNKLPEP